MPIPSQPKSFKELVLLTKAETTYGDDAAPSGVNAMRAYDVQIRPLQADKKTRSFIQSYLGARPSLLSMQRTELSFKIEACGGGTAGAAPPCNDTLLACALAATTVAATANATIAATATYGTGHNGRLTYARTTAYAGILARTVTGTCTTAGGSGVARFNLAAPAIGHLPAFSATNVLLTDATPVNLPGGAVITPTVGTSFSVGDTFMIALQPAETRYERTSDRNNHGSVSHYFVIDGERHKCIGWRGTAKLVEGIGDFPYFECQGTGFFIAPEAVSTPVGDYSDWTDPVHIGVDQTFLWVNGKEIVAKSAEIDLANNYSLIERIGRRAVRINDWATKFSTVIEAPDLTDLNLYTLAQARTRIPAQVLHGLTAGNAIFVDIASMQIDAPAPQEDEGDYMLSVTGDVLPVNGDDELRICFR
ncbi:hypothetical protein [Niveispirillum cyanobacteriorum]|uniref:Uncharacterized protein n=1 Tax=Niveispirillum cyanobacteriorum TaxID=1612173 RepID=A0A2K9NDN6_9PROT|nr:hypothetical protein [Niveispirillum cyanobacteriorum]AUN31238.1 hypothetical protein C0V82_14100 [Niveispirillum cyanobacteriorum]GGE73039.1 hypothetical protein GCM10011317_32840 [Niveispirillum cyanobacteriorum]